MPPLQDGAFAKRSVAGFTPASELEWRIGHAAESYPSKPRMGNVELPQEAFLAALKVGDDDQAAGCSQLRWG